MLVIQRSELYPWESIVDLLMKPIQRREVKTPNIVAYSIHKRQFFMLSTSFSLPTKYIFGNNLRIYQSILNPLGKNWSSLHIYLF